MTLPNDMSSGEKTLASTVAHQYLDNLSSDLSEEELASERMHAQMLASEIVNEGRAATYVPSPLELKWREEDRVREAEREAQMQEEWDLWQQWEWEAEMLMAIRDWLYETGHLVLMP